MPAGCSWWGRARASGSCRRRRGRGPPRPRPGPCRGYGLPVAEALACGAPVLAADASSLPEIVGPEALFDPTDPGPIAAAIERGLTDEGLRRRILSAAGRAPTTWAEVATATMDVYDR